MFLTESHNRHHQQMQQNQQNQGEPQPGEVEHQMRTSQSASCLSALSGTQLTGTTNGYRSESDPEDEPQATVSLIHLFQSSLIRF